MLMKVFAKIDRMWRILALRAIASYINVFQQLA